MTEENNIYEISKDDIIREDEKSDFLDRQFHLMYYVIWVLIILIFVVGYYLYIREGALGL